VRPVVLHCDNHVLALAKPAGVPVVPDESGDESLLDVGRRYVEETFAKPGRAFLAVVHRLDRPVSGVVVFGRTSKGADRLAAAFRERTAVKRYLGLVPTAPAERAGEVEQWLLKDERRNQVCEVAVGTPGARHAVTAWRVLAPARDGAPAVLLLEPHTGRSHQLRLACRALGAPLLGDLRYGAREPLADRSIGLHAWQLDLPHPTQATTLMLAATPPALDVWDAARAVTGS
jgi:23S rRNA pseudouridine1911/1915/1917 synthase